LASVRINDWRHARRDRSSLFPTATVFLSPSRDRATLAALRLASKDAYHAATPHLYREVLLSGHTSPVVTDIKIDEPGLDTVETFTGLVVLVAEANDDGSYFTYRRRSLRRLNALRNVEVLVVDDPELRIWDLIYDLKQRELIPRHDPHRRAPHPPELPLRNVFFPRLKRVSLGPTFCECLYRGGMTIWGPSHKLFHDVLEFCQGTDVEELCIAAYPSGGWRYSLGGSDNLVELALTRLPCIKRLTLHDVSGNHGVPSKTGLELRVGFSSLRRPGHVYAIPLDQPGDSPSDRICNRVADQYVQRFLAVTGMIKACAVDAGDAGDAGAGRCELVGLDNGLYCGDKDEHQCGIADVTYLEGRIRRWVSKSYGEGLVTDNIQERVRFLDGRHDAPSEDLECTVCHRSLQQYEESDPRYKPTEMHLQCLRLTLVLDTVTL
jgi:hypothetical protein